MKNNNALGASLENPKLTLFAFHICQELTENVTADAQEIWQHLAEIGTRLGIPPLVDLPEKLQILNQNTQTKQSQLSSMKWQELLPERTLELALDNGEVTLEGGIYPIQIHDTYAVDLTFRLPRDKVDISELAHLNPQGLLSPSQIRASLGQTWLFFARSLDDTEHLEAIARACVAQLISNSNSSNLDSFSLVGKGQLLDGVIYEFEDNLDNPSQRQHILIWLATHPQTVQWEATGDYYHPLLDLLSCRSKILFAYYQARQSYQEARQLYTKLEPIVRDFSQWKAKQNEWLKPQLENLAHQKGVRARENRIKQLLNDSQGELSDRVEAYLEEVTDKRLDKKLKQLSQWRLHTLEEWLVQMPLIGVNYACCLRDIQTQLTTIEINVINYQTALHSLQALNPSNDNLIFLEKFLTEDCKRYQQQIRYDFDYLSSGKALLDPTIESLRGLVEIEAQKKQLVEDLAEKERDRSIEVWVTVVGSGLAVSGLTSQILPEPVQPLFEYYHLKDYQQHWYGSPASLLFFNVLVHSLIGILSAILVAVVARGAIEKFIRFVSARVGKR